MRVELAPPGERIVFEDPSLVVRIERGDDVDAAFATLDAALAAGNAIAGYVTYELGAALAGAAIGDGAVPRDATLPLAAFGIYAAARRVRAPASNGGAFELAPPVALWSRRRYDDELARIAATLRAGDAYQINLTVPFGFAWDGEPRAMFDALVARAGVAHAALVEDGDRAFVSLSPELFLAIHTYNPCFENRSCSTSSAMSSARRNAPAYPSKSSARSRAAGKSSGIAISSAGSRSMRSGSFFFARFLDCGLTPQQLAHQRMIGRRLEARTRVAARDRCQPPTQRREERSTVPARIPAGERLRRVSSALR